MDAKTPSTSSAEASGAQQAAKEVRITSHGKMSAWVEFALKFFEENPDFPLTFHTLPATPAVASPPEHDIESSAVPKVKAKGEKMNPSTALVPRLVSVVEIIKREYVKMLDTSLAEKGTLTGLHQYNELGELECPPQAEEEDGTSNAEQERIQNLKAVIEGKNHLKIKKIAYMKITLCRKELTSPAAKSVTYQKPSTRQLSKSARMRAKKRVAKDAQIQEKV